MISGKANTVPMGGHYVRIRSDLSNKRETTKLRKQQVAIANSNNLSSNKLQVIRWQPQKYASTVATNHIVEKYQ